MMDRRTREVLGIILASWNRPLSVTALAKSVNLGSRRLEQIFKVDMGIPIKRFQKNIRLLKAAKLLGETHLRVSEIAYQVGYRDHNYFTKDFTKKFGKNPTSFRRNFPNRNVDLAETR